MILVAILGISLMPTSALAQPKSFEFRGEKVVLEAAEDVLLVRTKSVEKSFDLATRVLEAQSKLLGKSLEPTAFYFTKTPPRSVRQLNGLLVPRLPGLKDADLARLAAELPGVASCEPVYRVGEQLIMPRGTLAVRFAGPVQPRLLFALTQELQLQEIARPKYASNVFRYQPLGPNADPMAICEKLREKRFVRWAEPDLVVQLLPCSKAVVPNDTFFSQQWYLQPGESGIQVPEAWGESANQPTHNPPVAGDPAGIIVAVLDDGVDLQHKELQSKLVKGYDFLENDPEPQPDAEDAHGTACAGLIAAEGNNGTGIAGIAWNARIMPIRISGSEGFADNAVIGEAIAFAVQNGAKILSCSWGGKAPSNQIIDAIDVAADAGCLVIVAAGNAIPAVDVFYPARYERCMAIGAVQHDDTIFDYSCWGPGRAVDLVAPSGACGGKGDVWSTDHSADRGYNAGGATTEEPSGDYTAHFGGTSAATPIVAGVAALVWSSNPSLTADQLRQVLEQTATEVDPQGGDWVNGRSIKYGFGKVNALAALQQAKALATGSSTPAPPTSPTAPTTPGDPGLTPPATPPSATTTPSAPARPTTPGRRPNSSYIK
jgi:hypothetical protein